MRRGDRRAFSILLGLCLLAAAWVTWEQWIRPPRLAPQEAQALEVVWRSLGDTGRAPAGRAVQGWEDIQLFPFNPNGLPVDQWVLLGLSDRQAEAIHKYEARGGRFRTKDDLGRMRVVDPGLFALWKPYIQLPERAEAASRPSRGQGWQPRDTARAVNGERRERRASPQALVELNAADSATLVAIRGIGPAFARGIIRYRDRLGGFISLDQLAEVPILRDKPDAVEQLKQQLTLDPGAVRQIPINTCAVEELARHPYMNWKVAKALVAYRGQHGPFRAAEDIAGCLLVTDTIRARILPYITVE